MNDHKRKQHTLWLLAAITAPAAHFAGCGWLTALTAALAILPLNLLVGSWEGLPRPLAILELIWLGAMAGGLLQCSSVYWPSDNAIAVPLILLTLAAWTPKASAPRVGAVLALCIALTAIPAAASAAVHLELRWLRPTAASLPPALALILLLPSLPPAGEGAKGKSLLGAGAVTVLAGAAIQGVISPNLANHLPDVCFQAVRTLGYLEPLMAAGLTLGWFALASYLFQSGRTAAEGAGIKLLWATVLLWGTSTGFVLFQVQPTGWIWTVLSAFLWVLVPFLHKMNGFEKSEKT